MLRLTRPLLIFLLALLLTAAPALAAPPAQAEVNPLTGLLTEPHRLARRPLVVKISNESALVRPQTGLSFADHVWEHQMEGMQMTRFTAVFYSRAPFSAGSIRSTRLIDVEHLVPMYAGILITSGGSSNRADPASPPRIEERLDAQPWSNRVVSTSQIGGQVFDAPYLERLNIPRPGIPRYHRLFARPGPIWGYMQQRGLNERPQFMPLPFSERSPENGTPTAAVSLDFPAAGPRHIWYYEAGSRRWLSFTEDQLTAARRERRDLDFMTGRQLAFDNLVIVYAAHTQADFVEDESAQLNSVGVNLMGEGRAILLRDGARYEAVWRRPAPESLMFLFTPDGQLLAYKPGTVWYSVVSDGANDLRGPEIIFAP